MRKIALGLLGAGLLGGCGQIVGGFSAFNLSAPKEACSTSGSARELNLSFNYTGTLKGVNLTFTPNGKSPVAVNVADLAAPPAGLRVDTLTAGTARLFVNLAVVQPSAPAAGAQAIPQPDVRQVYPMDVSLQAIGSNGERPGLLSLPNIDVARCYVP